MKKLVYFFAMVLLLASGASAQTSLVATLSHEGTITSFYSANGLKDAYAAAADGDIITLSSGTFIATNIEKDLTIRGAGMDVENNPTIINGDLKLKNGSDGKDETRLTIEGVYVHGRVDLSGDLDNASFIKSRFNAVYLGGTNAPSFKNGVALSCIFDNLRLEPSSVGRTITISVYNSIVNTDNIDPTSATFSNCVIIQKERYAYSTSQNNSSFNSCIFINMKGNLSSSCNASYCYYKGTSKDYFQHMISKTNVMVGDDVTIFKDEETYELSDGLAESWLGADGTQVGIYGGSLPFDPTPSNPHITKFNVAPKTTADGKLSVEIEVKAN